MELNNGKIMGDLLPLDLDNLVLAIPNYITYVYFIQIILFRSTNKSITKFKTLGF